MKRILAFVIAIMLFQTVYAYTIEWGRTITITKPVYEDLYVAGGTVTLNAPVYGDVIVAGGTIYINDSVSNDLLIAGGTVFINGYIGDDVRCAGGQLHIQKNIGGDLVITGGELSVEKTVVVNGGLITGGGNLVVNGTINNNVKATGGKIEFNGIANKNFEARCQELIVNGTVFGTSVLAARNISVGANASFQNNVRYWNKDKKLDIQKNIHNGTSPVYDPSLKVQSDNWYYLGHATALGFIWYLSVVFLFILLIQYLFGKTFNKAGTTVTQSIWKSLGWGLLFFAGVPFVVLLFVVTIIGIPFGLILMLSYIGLLILATIITAIVIANWYNNKFQQRWSFWQLVLGAFFLFILLKIVTFTPLFGWLIMFVIACIAFGSLLRNIDWTGKHKMAIQ
jgi:hypothetical protein